ncbi:receptor-binding cancer antigen expressed on SiSo cells [Patella vulgata]|uniref:receptor-binding cancer antigen expressed on SiSo cells n=1 Tax=Patella vulgata TaxID=6465 RepID=UPI00217F2C35|nr:receptor-binding cancer antigen expressed on SiSo cells [Patella vulgata]XP_050389419.1 receptor-binding cancer antigen expressed on SiSo cells [Patella vulgata]XP_055956645.1 receptor-binding cancer antigen expressed on SiSo cells [Patella vulgata]
MKALLNIIRSLFNLIRYLLSPLKRAVCRRRRSSDSDFSTPMGMIDSNSMSIDMTQSYPSNSDIQMESWDTWGDQSSDHYSKTQQHINDYRTKLQKEEPEPEPEPDYFGGMEPSLKKTQKIVIKKRGDNLVNKTAISNRLAMVSDIPMQGSELDTWEDENSAWDQVGEEDLSYEAETAIKEKRRAERHQRHLEQQKRKLEKESRLGRKDRDIVAVKLS